MKKSVLMIVVALLTTVNVMGQRIQIMDELGNPVSYANILDADNGKLIGATNLEGVLVDVKGAKKIHISHVAFKPQEVSVSNLKDGRITLKESDFDLPEIVVKKKDYIYVQTYYRVMVMMDDTLAYYRSGLTDNVYDIQKKKVSASHRHFSKSFMGILKVAFDMAFGSKIDGYSKLPIKGHSNVNGNGKGLKMIKETETRQRVTYNGQVVGYIVDDESTHQRRLSMDYDLYNKLYIAEHGTEKQKAKRKKSDAQIQNSKSTYSMVYQRNDGQSNVEDFVSRQLHRDMDRYDKKEQKTEHMRMWLEVYATDRAYVTKQELKEKKRANRINMSFDTLQRFERQHGIPALPANTLKALKKIVEK